jgi:hypothetical protein
LGGRFLRQRRAHKNECGNEQDFDVGFHVISLVAMCKRINEHLSGSSLLWPIPIMAADAA